MNYGYNPNYQNAYPPNAQPQIIPNSQQVPQNQPQMDCNCDFIVVSGPQAVKDYVVRPGQKRYFQDANNPIMYVKQADAFGMCNTEAFIINTASFEELLRQDTVGSFPGVPRDEYNDLVERMNKTDEVLRQLVEKFDNLAHTQNSSNNKGGNKYESNGNKPNNKR